MMSLFIIVVLIAGLAAARLLQLTGTPDGWELRGNIGDSFGVMNAMVSGLALAALVATLWLQSRELALQRTELAMQREALSQSRDELRRNAEASLSTLHQEMIKLSINDPALAAVWPPLDPNGSQEKERQYLYANLIYQHLWLGLRIGDYTEDSVQNSLRYLFRSAIFREYWRAASTARMSLVPGSKEYRFAEAAGRICKEYEDLLAVTRPSSADPLVRMEPVRSGTPEPEGAATNRRRG
jgi:hypothetical protein